MVVRKNNNIKMNINKWAWISIRWYKKFYHMDGIDLILIKSVHVFPPSEPIR